MHVETGAVEKAKSTGLFEPTSISIDRELEMFRI